MERQYYSGSWGNKVESSGLESSGSVCGQLAVPLNTVKKHGVS
jgi:hypothetical protein